MGSTTPPPCDDDVPLLLSRVRPEASSFAQVRKRSNKEESEVSPIGVRPQIEWKVLIMERRKEEEEEQEVEEEEG